MGIYSMAFYSMANTMDAPSLQTLINTANTNTKTNNVNANNKKITT